MTCKPHALSFTVTLTHYYYSTGNQVTGKAGNGKQDRNGKLYKKGRAKTTWGSGDLVYKHRQG